MMLENKADQIARQERAAPIEPHARDGLALIILIIVIMGISGAVGGVF